MKSFRVTCPSCSTEFEPIEAQSQFIKKEIEHALSQGKAQIAKQQQELAVKEAVLKHAEEAISERVEQALKLKMGDIEKKVQQDTTKKVEVKFQDLQNQIAEKEAALNESNAEQLKLTKLVREANERQQNLDLEVEQKVLEKIDVVQ